MIEKAAVLLAEKLSTGPKPKSEPTGYVPNHGHDWNPLRAHRNIPCPCGSGEKSKRCCGAMTTVPTDVAEKLKRWLERKHGK